MLAKKVKTNKLSTLRNVYKTRPVLTFVLFLILLAGLIGFSKYLREPKEETKLTELPVEVELFDLSSPLKLTVQGSVDKSSIFTTVSLAPGVVSKINITEGQLVYSGTQLASIAQNYTGGNAVSVQRQIAQKQLDNINDTFFIQKELIDKQHKAAEKLDNSADEVRSITEKSIGDTRVLIDLTEDIEGTLKDNLLFLEANNPNNVNDEQILILKQSLSAAQSGLIQLRSSVRTLNYQADDSKPPAELSDIQRDIAIKGLELQEQGLYLSKDLAALGLKALQIAESSFYPTSAYKGTVEKIHVTKNQSIAPGMPIATIKTDDRETQITASVPENFAKLITPDTVAQVYFGSDKLKANPSYISTVPTDGSLYTVKFIIEDPGKVVASNSFVIIDLELKSNCAENNSCLIPISALNQTQDKTTLFLADQNTAKLAEIQIGNVAGSYVEITSGINKDDVVITSRNVVDGDNITSL